MNAKVRRLSDPPPRVMLKPEQLDSLGEALIALTREVWVLTDRVAVLEAVLESSGALASDAVDRFQPSGEFEKALGERRAALIERIESTLRGEA
jgi:hypothetical protein